MLIRIRGLDHLKQPERYPSSRPRRYPYPLLKKSPFRERQTAVVADDQMIEHADVDQRERIAQSARDEFVGLTGLSDA